jgi:predicted AAA+ superfamily ATPase
MYIPRFIEKTILEALKTFPVVILTGARQTGKTTLVKHLFKDTFTYLSLDELDIRSLAINEPREFLARYRMPMIIDEIQNAPDLLPYIKSIIDNNRKNGMFIITGSQQFPLMRNVSESLAGRAAILNLYPFSTSEITGNTSNRQKDILKYLKSSSVQEVPEKPKADLGTMLLTGGYPGLYRNKEISKNLWFSSYIQTYIDRDIRGNIRNENLTDFENFIRLLASRTAQELSYSAFSRDIGISVPTIKSWVSLLQASSIIYLLKPYYKNFGKRLIKSPKLYFIDCGLAAYLTGIDTKEHLLKGPMAGPLFETFIVGNLLKRFSSLYSVPPLYYWKNIGGIEVDLIIEYGNVLIPIEIKLTTNISGKHFGSLVKWVGYSGSGADSIFFISNSPLKGRISQNIQNINWYNL